MAAVSLGRNLFRKVPSLRHMKYNRKLNKAFLSVTALGNNEVLLHDSKTLGHVSLKKIIPQRSSPFYTSTLLYNGDIRTVKTPQFPESITEGDIKWLKQEGDYVEEDETVAEIETDKTAIGVPAPAAGTIDKLLCEDGSKVVVGAELFLLRLGGGGPSASTEPTDEGLSSSPDDVSEQPALETTPEPMPVPEEPASVDEEPTPSIATPEEEETPPPVPPLPSEPISTTPVAEVTKQLHKFPVAPQAKAGPPLESIKGTRTETRVKMSRMRLRIAQRLKEAQNTCAMLTTFNECDMSEIMKLRNEHKDAFLKKHGVKLGLMSPFVKASAYALSDQPIVNAVIDGNEIIYRDYVDISVAVATPKGLVVPVLRNVEQMDYADIEKSIREFGEKARTGALAIEDMDGGTFTISNGGVFGSMMGTPIINPPQSAILGMHAINERPVAVQGKVEIRPMMYLALTYDHRLIDGRDAVLFLRKVKQAVENPASILLGV